MEPVHGNRLLSSHGGYRSTQVLTVTLLPAVAANRLKFLTEAGLIKIRSVGGACALWVRGRGPEEEGGVGVGEEG